VKQRRRIRSPRKVIIRAGIFLLLGAIVNIAVAWGIALWSACEMSDRQATIEETQSLDSPDAEKGEHSFVQATEFRCSGGIWIALLKVGRFHEVPEATSLHAASGLPLHSMSLHRTVQFTDEAAAAQEFRWLLCLVAHLAGDTVRDPYYGSIVPDFRRPLPVHPLWPGFAINTLFYAAILWLLLALPGALRRMRRIKRGLCPACAYPIGTSELCTECGKPVRASTT
jgi:hypothetical protein